MKNYNRNNHRQFSNRGVQRYNTPRPQYNLNHIKIKRDGSYEGDVKNLDHSLGAMGMFAGILLGLGYLFKSLFNDSEEKRKEKYEQQMSNIRVNEHLWEDKRKLEYEQQMSNIRTDEHQREDKRKEEHEQKMSNIREAEHQREYVRKVVYEQHMSKIRTDEYREKSKIRVEEFLRKHSVPPQPKSLPQSQPVNPDVEDAEVIEEMPASSDASTSVPTDGISSNELFDKIPKAIHTNWIVDGYMKAGLVNYLVAGTGLGKTIFATQIALAVDKGIRPEFLPPTCCESVKLDVVYYRMEDFEGELDGKYGEGKVLRESGIEWILPDHLPEFTIKGFLDHIKAKAGNLKRDTLACADPLTKIPGWTHAKFISGVEEAQKIAKANGHTLTILVIVHPEEPKNGSVPTNDKIEGGDKGIQQAGSVTAMGLERRGDDYRYLKSLKEPKGSPKPFNGKVLVMKLDKTQLDPKNSYLRFVHVDTKKEAEALPLKLKAQATAPVTPNATSPSPQKKAPNQKVTLEMAQKMMEMYAKGKTMVEIGKEVGLCEKRVSHYLKAFEAQKPDKH